MKTTDTTKVFTIERGEHNHRKSWMRKNSYKAIYPSIRFNDAMESYIGTNVILGQLDCVMLQINNGLQKDISTINVVCG